MSIQFSLFSAQTVREKDEELRVQQWLEAEEWVKKHGGGPVTVVVLYRLSMEKFRAMGFTEKQLSEMPGSWKDILDGFVNFATLEEQRWEMKKKFASCNIKWPW